jgi:hypothetical protein
MALCPHYANAGIKIEFIFNPVKKRLNLLASEGSIFYQRC